MKFEIKNLSKIFYKNRKPFFALDNLNISFSSPAIWAILGPNGAGKTTLLKIISGITLPSSGQILLDGNPLNASAQHQLGFSAENPFFPKNLNPVELLQFGLQLLGRKADKGQINSTLQKVGLEEEKTTRIKNFSKGMLQRLSVAAAIIHSPPLLILDEPMSGLDPVGRKTVKNILRESYEDQKLIIFSSHNLEDVETIATDLIILQQGRIVLQQKMSDLRAQSAFSVELHSGNHFTTHELQSLDELIGFIEKRRAAAGEIIRIGSNLARKLENYYEKN